MIDLRILPDAEWASTVASEWADRLDATPNLRMCLPTGSTPVPVYRNIAPRADFRRSTVFLLDEFGLPPGDPARCDVMFERDFLSLLRPPPARVERLNPEAADRHAECTRFDIAISRGGLALTLLGLGKNGHLGMNEPGSMADSPTRVVDLAPVTVAGMNRYGAEAATSWGMTTGLGPLLASDEIWLLVTGAAKARILEQALHGPVSPMVPASLLRTASKVVVWADESAAQHVD